MKNKGSASHLNKLKRKSNRLFESLSCFLDDDEIERLNELLEVERELTLLEEQPN